MGETDKELLKKHIKGFSEKIEQLSAQQAEFADQIKAERSKLRPIQLPDAPIVLWEVINKGLENKVRRIQEQNERNDRRLRRIQQVYSDYELVHQLALSGDLSEQDLRRIELVSVDEVIAKLEEEESGGDAEVITRITRIVDARAVLAPNKPDRRQLFELLVERPRTFQELAEIVFHDRDRSGIFGVVKHKLAYLQDNIADVGLLLCMTGTEPSDDVVLMTGFKPDEREAISNALRKRRAIFSALDEADNPSDLYNLIRDHAELPSVDDNEKLAQLMDRLLNIKGKYQVVTGREKRYMQQLLIQLPAVDSWVTTSGILKDLVVLNLPEDIEEEPDRVYRRKTGIELPTDEYNKW
jgi:hypothetical protein